MIFEHALLLMRQGKKARIPRYKEGEYYEYAYDEKGSTLIKKMKNEIHPDMKGFPSFIFIKDIMSEDLEIVDGI